MTSPADDPCQSSTRLADRTSCSTGASTAPKGPTDARPGIPSAAAAGSDTAKLVMFMMTSVFASASSEPMIAAASPSFRLALNNGSGFNPASRQASIIASTGARSPACSKAR